MRDLPHEYDEWADVETLASLGHCAVVARGCVWVRRCLLDEPPVSRTPLPADLLFVFVARRKESPVLLHCPLSKLLPVWVIFLLWKRRASVSRLVGAHASRQTTAVGDFDWLPDRG